MFLHQLEKVPLKPKIFSFSFFFFFLTGRGGQVCEFQVSQGYLRPCPVKKERGGGGVKLGNICHCLVS